MKNIILSSLTALLLLSSAPALASGGHPSKAEEKAAEQMTRAFFNEVERALIYDYFGVDTADGKGKGKKKGLPPGLAKRDRLPPGLEKQLQKNGRLPPGLQKKLLPGELSGRLPVCAGRHECAIVGTDVILIEAATGIVRDILRDVLRG